MLNVFQESNPFVVVSCLLIFLMSANQGKIDFLLELDQEMVIILGNQAFDNHAAPEFSINFRNRPPQNKPLILSH